jgi:hypothetical protein
MPSSDDHRRHAFCFIAKVYINVVFTNIFVNTPPPLYYPHDGHIYIYNAL